MRQQDKIIMWPAYFDSTKTRNDGRRISKSSAVPSPRIQEMEEAVKKLGLAYEVRTDVGYSKTPWLKTGMILVKKKDSKEKVMKSVAAQLLKMRSEPQQPKNK